MSAYLLFVEDSAEAVEELEGGEDLALHEHAGDDGRCCPPSCACGHFEPPLFEWKASESTISSAEHGGHVDWVDLI